MLIKRLFTGLGLLSVVALTINPTQAIQVYKYTGSHGEVKYSQYPPRDAKNVEVIEFRSDGRRVDPGKLAGKVNENDGADQPTAEQQRIAQLEKKVKEQEEQATARKCKVLRDNLTNLSVQGKVFETDENGNRRYLDSREIELKRERVEQALKQYCSGQGTSI